MKKGFTLIEVLVVVGLLLLTTGGVVSNYNNYNDRQKVKQATLTLKDNLRLAQTSAMSGNKPTGCSGQLTGYQVAFTSSTLYTITALCAGGNGPTVSISMPSDVSIASPVTITFSPLTGEANVATYADISVSSFSVYTGVRVTKNGQISDVVIPTPTPTIHILPTATSAPIPTPTHTLTPAQSPTPLPGGWSCADNCAVKVAGGPFSTKTLCQNICGQGIPNPPGGLD
jgi:prepilin-type N-terminal cleavage/methylation domain-containing protein